MDAFDVQFGTAVQRFWYGVASCAVPGTAADAVLRGFADLPALVARLG